MDAGKLPIRVFFSSDPNLSTTETLESYAGRWSIEVAFRNLKQHLGFADSPARLRRAVERTAPFAGLLYTALVLWFVEHCCDAPLALVPARSWYRHKATLSFEDVLRAARIDIARTVFDPAPSSDNLQNASRPAGPRLSRRTQFDTEVGCRSVRRASRGSPTARLARRLERRCAGQSPWQSGGTVRSVRRNASSGAVPFAPA